MTGLADRRAAAVPRGVAHACPVFADRAQGSEVWDADGRRYIDFASGIAVCNVGHGHPDVVAAARAQLERCIHVAFQVSPYEPYVALAERLCAAAPGEHAKKAVLFSTGAEAVENAVKIARVHTGRRAVVAFTGGFHGRTMLTLALTGKVVPYKHGFGPFPGEVYHVPFPAEYRCIDAGASLHALEMLTKGDVAPDEIAAVVIEPVLGEGGFYVAPADFLRRLRSWCDEHGVVLVIDEIQSGFARTGRMFAIEHSEVVPDLMTVAKSLAGGLPLSGVVGRAEIMDAPMPGGLGGTYGGNPVACAAALAVLDVIEREGLCERAAEVGERITGRLHGMAEWCDAIGDVRGLGAMCAFELVEDRNTRAAHPALTAKLQKRALENGLLILACGLYSNVIRLLAPLTVPEDQLDEGLDLLETSLREVP